MQFFMFKSQLKLSVVDLGKAFYNKFLNEVMLIWLKTKSNNLVNIDINKFKKSY